MDNPNITMSKAAPTELSDDLIRNLVTINRGNGITFLYRINAEKQTIQFGLIRVPTKEFKSEEKEHLAVRMRQLELKQIIDLGRYKNFCSEKEHTDAIIKTYSNKGLSVALIHGGNNKVFSAAIYDSEHSEIGKDLALCLLYAFAKTNDVWDPKLFSNSNRFIPKKIGLLAHEIDAVIFEPKTKLSL